MRIIGVTGGSGSGKSYFCSTIKKIIPEDICVISQDSYYHDNSHLSLAERHKLNFDHPDAFDFKLLLNHLISLKKGKPIEVPVYSYKYHTRTKIKNIEYPKKIILVEGILILYNNYLNDIFDLTIYIDIDKDTRLKRIVERDIRERARIAKHSIDRFENVVEPMYLKYVLPTRQKASYIIKSSQPDTNIIKAITQL